MILDCPSSFAFVGFRVFLRDREGGKLCSLTRICSQRILCYRNLEDIALVIKLDMRVVSRHPHLSILIHTFALFLFYIPRTMVIELLDSGAECVCASPFESRCCKRSEKDGQR